MTLFTVSMILLLDTLAASASIGVELVRDRAGKEPATAEAAAILEHMREAGVLPALIGRHRNILKIRPPLVFRREHADGALEKLDEALHRVGAA